MKITIVDDEGNTLKKRMVGTEEGFQALLDKYQVSWLVNDDGFEVTLFEDLQEGTYTLGDKIAETIDLELSLKSRKKALNVSLKEGEQTIDDLEQLTRANFGIPLARVEFTLPHNVPLDSDAKLQEIPKKVPMKVEVSVTRVGFSSILTVKDALKLLGQRGDSIPIDNNAFPQQANIDQDSGEILHAVSTLERLQTVVPLPQGCEATRRLYIDPILLASARLAGDVLMQVEKMYESKDVHGPIDYVFKFGEQTICVTEGKKDDIDGGVIQNVAQLSAVSDDRKRKLSEISQDEGEEQPIYGIATTYLNWSFLVLRNGKIAQSNIHCIRDGEKTDVCDIVGRIVAILLSGKGKGEKNAE